MKARSLLAVLALLLALVMAAATGRTSESAFESTAAEAQADFAAAPKPTKTPRPTNPPTATPLPTNTSVPTAPTPTDTPAPTPPAGSAARAKQLVYNYVKGIEGNQILSGQQEAEWVEGLSQDLNYIRTTTGKSPAIRGFESQLTSNIYKARNPTDISIASWRDRGFIISWSWHMGAPIAGDHPIETDDYDHSKLTVDVNAVLTPGTAENQNFIAKLDAQAERLQKLEDYGVPVLWRPLHEMNGNWFWWSKSGPDAYIQLWVYMYNYFTNAKGLDNLIWVWSTIRGPQYGEGNPPGTDFYPGDRFVDILGGDLYTGATNFDWLLFETAYSDFTSTWDTKQEDKVAAMTEGAAIPDPQELLAGRNLSYVWFLPWYGDYVKKNNPPEYLTYVYNSTYTITLDELPDLKSASEMASLE